jgi:hypothetical protein
MFKSILICVLTALLSLAMVAVPTQAVPDRPDIIVILTDDKRADDWPVLAKRLSLLREPGIRISSTPRRSASGKRISGSSSKGAGPRRTTA